jgi:hypothetical protein
VEAREALSILTALNAEYVPAWSPLDLLHPGELALFLEEARNVVVVAGRRWGKSHTAVARGIDECRKADGVAVAYIAASRPSVKKMAWRTLKDLNRVHRFGGLPNESELSMTFPNGSTFYLLGVDTEALADKVRGIQKLALCIVDESQRYKPDLLAYLLRDCVRPALRDVRGRLWVMGTPNPLGKVGALWERWESGRFAKHGGTIYDNTKLGTKEQTEAIIAEDLAAEGQTKESAWFRREYLAQWEADHAARVYHFSDEANVYDELPTNLTHFYASGDIGVKGSDAVIVCGWADDDPTLYLVYEHIKAGQTDDDLGLVLAGPVMDFDPVQIDLDGGGGGKKTVLTLQARYPGLPILEAVKPPINQQVAALNDRLRNGRFKVRRDSRFYKEVRQSAWVNGVVNGKIEEHGHSDVVPAARYLAIGVRPYLPDEPDEPLPPEVAKAAAYEAERIARQERARRASEPRQDPDDDEVSDWDDGEPW